MKNLWQQQWKNKTFVLFIALLFLADRELLCSGETEEKKKDGDLEALFYRVYPRAVERLRDALKMVRGKGRFSSQSWASENKSWSDLEFYMKEGNIRLEWKERLGKEALGAGAKKPLRRGAKEPEAKAPLRHEAILITPTISAKVLDPNTKFAFNKYEGDEPTPVMEREFQILVGQFIKTAYCDGSKPALERINDGSWVVTNITKNKDQNEWITLECDMSLKPTNPDHSDDRLIKGKVIVSFSPKQDWSIRKLEMQVNQPRKYTITYYIDDLLLSANGFIPKKVRRFYTSAEAKGPWLYLQEFEMTETSTERIADSAFSVEALGAVSRQKNSARNWIIGIISGLIFLSAWGALRWYKKRKQLTP